MNLNTLRLLAALALFSPIAWTHAAIVCSVSSPGFTATYDVTAVTQTIVQTYVSVNCTRGQGDPTSLPYLVGADNGAHASGGSNRAALGTNYVNYDIYQDSLCGTEWADGPNRRLGGTLDLSSGSGSATISYWGCLPPSQTTATVGTHTDIVNMTLYEVAGQGQGQGQLVTLASGSFNVNLMVGGNCSITTAPGNIIFNYTSFGSAVNASTTFAATCTNQLPYTIALDATSGTVLGTNYTLALSTNSAIGTGAAQTYTITGSMAGGQGGSCTSGTCSATQSRTLTISY